MPYELELFIVDLCIFFKKAGDVSLRFDINRDISHSSGCVLHTVRVVYFVDSVFVIM